MSFLAPVMFWIAAAVMPALLILYFLKLRRRAQTVASTLLWKRAVQDLQVNAPFQKLRKNLLLLLQLLILAAGIFALARPVVNSPVSDEKSVILLVDRSASMNTLEGEQTRLDQAKEQARRLIRSLATSGQAWWKFWARPEDQPRVMVIAFADRAQVIAPFTYNLSDAARLVEGIAPSDARTNLREALELAEAYMMQTTVEQNPESAAVGSSIVVLSDGGFGDLRDVVLRSGGLKVIKIGESRDNAAITSLRIQRGYENPEDLSVFVQVENFGDAEISTDVALYLDGRIGTGRVQSVTLGPARGAGDAAGTSQPSGDQGGSSGALTFEFPMSGAGIIEARLSRDDALSTDNQAWAIVPPPRKLKALLVSDRNFFLEKALKNLPLERFIYMTPAEYEGLPKSEIESDGRMALRRQGEIIPIDVAVIDQHDTARLPRCNYLFVGGVPEIPEVKVSGEIGWHAMQWWDETHPVLRHVALEYVYAAKGRTLSMPREAQTLIEGPQGPVLTRYSKDGRQYLILTFSIAESTWWNKLGFPVFLYNALRFLGSGAAIGESEPTRPGDSFDIPLPPGVESATVTSPDNQKTTVTPDPTGIARFAGTARVGVYSVAPAAEGAARYAVNLEDGGESNITPRADVKLAEGVKVTVGEGIRTATPEIWRWFLATALVILLTEWYIYNRRVVV